MDARAYHCVGEPVRFESSGWRWWVLLLFSLAAMMQAMAWNVFAPISDCLKTAYGEQTFSDRFISWAADTANIAFLLATFPMSVAVERYGPRVVTLGSAGMIVLCTGVRLVPVDGTNLQAVLALSMVFNGLAGSWLNFGGPILSECWFPAEQRTMATAIGSVACYLGGALGFVVGPVTVGSHAGSPEQAKAAVQRLFLLEFGISAAVFVAIWARFPDQPTLPPSQAALVRRGLAEDGSAAGQCSVVGLASCRAGSRRLVKFWTVALCMGLPLGVYQAWTAVLYLNLQGFISQSAAGWLGCWMTISGCAGSIAVGAALDRLSGYLKTATVLLMALATFGFVIFSLCVAGSLPVSHEWAVVLAYISGIWGGFFFNCSIPLFFEMTMEVCFGWCPDSTATPMLIFVNTIVQIVFLAVPTKIGGSALWMNWLTAGTMLVCTVPVVMLEMEYARSDCDMATLMGPEPQAAAHEPAHEKPTRKSIASWFDKFGCL